MKTSSEYRALAWKELRTKFGPSSIIVGATLALGLIALLAFLLPLMFLSDQSPLVIGCIMLVMVIIIYGTIGLLEYYIPVWYLSLARADKGDIAGTKCSYGRAIATVIMMTFPMFFFGFISGLINSLGKEYILIVLAVIIALYCFIFWWIYAVNYILPLVVLDHKELSVWKAVKRSISMMKGYKWKLFKVHLRIIFWPMLIMFVWVIALSFILVLAKEGGNLSLPLIITMIAIGAILFLAIYFVILPMFYFANAHFYGDLRDEQSTANNSNDC